MPRGPLIVGIVAGAVLCLLWSSHPGASKALAAQPPPNATNNTNQQLAALQTEINRLKGIVGDQSHAMADVGYHFANLWFAGEKKNWPLAKFYFDETRAHVSWSIRVIPVRKDS
ncbi:MAG TPA: hypothetical protein VK530_13095, partial [Candidatus Acidoferrum sp.]|nr:hypothetical protein [Candidatus Acidoferrum sp.]